MDPSRYWRMPGPRAGSHHREPDRHTTGRIVAPRAANVARRAGASHDGRGRRTTGRIVTPRAGSGGPGVQERPDRPMTPVQRSPARRAGWGGTGRTVALRAGRTGRFVAPGPDRQTTGRIVALRAGPSDHGSDRRTTGGSSHYGPNRRTTGPIVAARAGSGGPGVQEGPDRPIPPVQRSPARRSCRSSCPTGSRVSQIHLVMPSPSARRRSSRIFSSVTTCPLVRPWRSS